MNKISEFREALGWSQGQLAAALQVSRQAVSYWETGARTLSVTKALAVIKLAREHGHAIEMEDLYAEHNTAPRPRSRTGCATA